MSELQSIKWVGKSLNTKMTEMLDEGFVMIWDCIFLKALLKFDTNTSLQNFPDKTGYECFVNSIHTDEFVSDEHLIQACLFVESLFYKWKQFTDNETLEAIISDDEFGTVIKFHLLRSGEFFLNEDLEGYEDAVLVADSSSPFLELDVYRD